MAWSLHPDHAPEAFNRQQLSQSRQLEAEVPELLPEPDREDSLSFHERIIPAVYQLQQLRSQENVREDAETNLRVYRATLRENLPRAES